MVEPTVYTYYEPAGVVATIVAGALSILAILVAFATGATRTLAREDTHIRPYFISLLMANFVQSFGTVMNAKWVQRGYVFGDSFCVVQGVLKHVGNIATAMWAFVVAAHLFHLLFLRWKTTKTGLYLTLTFGWSIVFFIASLGPTVIANSKNGPYFGVSGLWCWITPNYPREQFFLEYFFEFFAAGIGFFMYTATLLRVRGNLVKSEGKWRLRWVPRGESWQLAITRDMIDSAMVRVAAHMVWYPIAYSLLLLPIALARMTEFAMRVPNWATILCDVIFNLNGFVNVILLVTTKQRLPDTDTLPSFATPRKSLDLSSPAAVGITPFVMTSAQEEKESVPERRSLALARSDSNASVSSVDSDTPLVAANPARDPYSVRY
ncbi:hypothetical protein NEOLEDRAFT_1180657 [Neolentinus lepideus HHB14362 ss-1]|uniref:Uncharacterized protein n=1 Tax=Neolentinus lepideus HHB14362 ss-1 TaxID=1314782 RepID=A0A165QQQ4_9AGAM|nr:hypothetical protein NEOLEDRAFT_1180657 [Neolentinus lepideus HHB14362 ss-1]